MVMDHRGSDHSIRSGGLRSSSSATTGLTVAVTGKSTTGNPDLVSFIQQPPPPNSKFIYQPRAVCYLTFHHRDNCAMKYGHSVWVLGMGTGYGFWVWVLGMGARYGYWVWVLCMHGPLQDFSEKFFGLEII